MEERIYSPYTGQVVAGRTTHPSAAVYDLHPRRAAQPPADQPQPDAHVPTAPFDGTGYGQWNPSASPADPHDADYDVDDGGDDFAYGDDGGDGVDDGPTTGEVPDNIIT